MSRETNVRREAILDAARRRFARYGYAGTSMSQIAAAASVTKASLYYHFPDKGTLFREAIQDALRRLRGRIADQTRGCTDSRECLRCCVQAYLDQFVEQRDLLHRINSVLSLPESRAPWAAELLEEYERPIRQSLARCGEAGEIDPSDIDSLTTLLMGAIGHAVTHWLLAPGSRRPGPATVDQFLARLLPPPRAPRRTGAVAGTIGALLLAGAALAGAQTPDDVIHPIPGPCAEMQLGDCITEALEANATLEAERVRRRELTAQMTQAVSIGLPSIDLTGTWSRGRDPSFALDQTFQSSGDGGGESALDSLLSGISFLPEPEAIPAQTFWRTSLGAHWELNPYLIYNAVSAAGSGIRRQDLLIQDVEHRTIEEVMGSYYAVLMAAEHLEALDAELASREEFLKVTRRRHHLGLSTGLDTLRAAVSYANLVPQRRAASQDLRDAAAHLNVVMGRDPLTPLALATEVSVEETDLDIDRAVARVPERPDIQGLEHLTTILKKNRGAQQAAHRPSISADASYGYVTGELGDLFDDGHDFWSASLSLNVPLFDGLLTRGRVQEAEAVLRRTFRDLDEARRRARLEILSLAGDLDAARANHQAARLNLTAAVDAARQMALRYELGKADYLSVLAVQADRFLARSNLIGARNEVLTLTASLKRAMGYSPRIALREISDHLRHEPSE